jgi:predicted nucleic acid-binding protein
MSRFVVDASVGAKWFLPEPGAADALRLQDPAHELHVPAFFDLEVANILWKAVRQKRVSRPDADIALGQLTGLSLVRHPDGPLVAAAFDIAHRADRTAYDSLYVAVAVHIGAVLVTSDDRLVNALAGTPWAGHVMRLADVP